MKKIMISHKFMGKVGEINELICYLPKRSKARVIERRKLGNFEKYEIVPIHKLFYSSFEKLCQCYGSKFVLSFFRYVHNNLKQHQSTTSSNKHVLERIKRQPNFPKINSPQSLDCCTFSLSLVNSLVSLFLQAIHTLSFLLLLWIFHLLKFQKQSLHYC